MDRIWQWAGVMLFALAAVVSAGNFALSLDHPDEIADARANGAVLAAGLAAVGAILAIAAYLSSKDKPGEKASPSGRELASLILVAVGLLAITNMLGWWYVTRDITGGLRSIGIGLVLIVVGVLLLRRPKKSGRESEAAPSVLSKDATE